MTATIPMMIPTFCKARKSVRQRTFRSAARSCQTTTDGRCVQVAPPSLDGLDGSAVGGSTIGGSRLDSFGVVVLDKHFKRAKLIDSQISKLQRRVKERARTVHAGRVRRVDDGRSIRRGELL